MGAVRPLYLLGQTRYDSSMKKEPQVTSLLWRIRKQPSSVVTTLLSAVPEYKLLDCKTVVADLAMGDGSYLAEISRRRVANGATIEEAQKTLYGYEKSPVYLEAARKLNGLQHANLGILRPDTDLDPLSMKFDVIIGNPPYQAPKNANGAKSPQPLWRKFLVKGEELLKDGGHMSLLLPSNVAKFHKENERSPALQKVKSLAIVSIDTGMEAFFNVGTEISCITFSKEKQSDLISLNGKPWDWKCFPWVPTTSDERKIALLKKLFAVPGRQRFVPQSHAKPLTVNTGISVGAWGMNRGKDYALLSLENFDKVDRKAHLMCAELTSKQDRNKFLLLFSSPVYQFIKSMTMFGSDVSFNTLSSLPVPQGWEQIDSVTDVIELFDLTEEEVALL